MANNSDIAWKQIGILAGTGLGCLLIGTFVVAPMLQKRKAKKLADKKKQTTQTTKK